MKIILKKIILPYLISSIGILVVYSSVYWLIFLKLNLLEYHEFIFRAFVPFLISTIIVFVKIRKTIEIIDYKNIKKKHGTLLIASMLLGVPVLTFNFYLNTFTGKLTEINSIEDIRKFELTKYYSIDSAITLKNKTGINFFESTNRSRENLIYYYFACPLTYLDSNINNNVWIGLKVEETFSNRFIDDKLKQKKAISKFKESTIIDYNKYIFDTRFLKRIINSPTKKQYIKAIENAGFYVDNSKIIIFEEEKGEYKTRTRQYFQWTVILLIVSNILWTLFVLADKNEE